MQSSSIGQLYIPKPTPHTFDGTALYSNICQQFSAYIYSTHALTINQFWVGPQAPQPFIYVPTYVPTYVHNTSAHSCMQPSNRVSGRDSTSLWEAYPGVLSDTATMLPNLVHRPFIGEIAWQLTWVQTVYEYDVKEITAPPVQAMNTVGPVLIARIQ